MKLEEALQFADEWTKGHTFYEGMQGWRVVCAVLAAEVRRLRAAHETSPAPTIKCKDCLDTGEQLGVYGRIKCGCKKEAEPDAVPVAWEFQHSETGAMTAVDKFNIENGFEKQNPRWIKVGPLYRHPPRQIDAETKKLQSLLCENARLSILNHLYEQISDGREEFSAMDMDYWDSSHDKLLDAMQSKIDADTRKLVLELCESLWAYESYLPQKILNTIEDVKEKLGAGK